MNHMELLGTMILVNRMDRWTQKQTASLLELVRCFLAAKKAKIQFSIHISFKNNFSQYD